MGSIPINASAVLIAGAVLVAACPGRVEAQGLPVLGGLVRTVSDSWKRIVSDPQRFRICPELVIDPHRRLGNATMLSTDGARRLILVLDSCQSGAVVESFRNRASPGSGNELDDAVAQKSLRRVARVGRIHVLAASRAHEDAKELQVVPHGALTYLVIEGIRGAADGVGDHTGGGRITVREIVDYAAREMPSLAHRLVQEPVSQIPVGYSRGEDFAVAER